MDLAGDLQPFCACSHPGCCHGWPGRDLVWFSNFEFSYGTNSYKRHLKSATESGKPTLVVADSKFAFDIDDPDDLALLV